MVGRQHQLAVLDDAWRVAQSGALQLVVVSGEAGAGKTRLLEHFASTAEAAGPRVLRSACVPLGAEGLPLAPATAVLRTLVDEGGTRALSDLVPGGDGMLRLLPELGAAEGEPGGQARLFELFGALLRRLGAQRPLVLLIDDLQWADRSTLDLLQLLVRTLRSSRVLLAGAYRSDDVTRGHPLRRYLAELERLPGVRRIEVERLSRAETAELLAGVLGHPPTGELLDRVYRSCGGNPFFAVELARAPVPETIPESLRDLLVDRVARLPRPAARVVRLVAVGGQPISHDLLAAVAGLAEDELLEAVRAAADGGVLRAGPDGYALPHRLLRAAVVDDLLPAERIRLHRTYAEALEADQGLVPPDRLAAATAFHWYEAGTVAKALPALLRAAEAAQRIYAHAEQVQLLDRALRPPAAGAGSMSGPDRLGLFETAIAAATWAGNDLDALELLDRALVEADRVQAPERVALLLAHRGMLLQNLHREGASTAVTEALELLPADRSLARARILDLASAVLAVRGQATPARELAAEAAEIAAAHGEPGLEANARTTVGWALSQLGQHQDGRAALQAAGALAAGQSDPVRLARVDLNLAEVEHRLGDYPAVIEAAQRGLRDAEAAGLGRTLGMLLSVQLTAARFAVGRWDEADQASRQAIDRDPTGAPGATLHAQRAEIALARGERDRARDQLSLARSLLDPAAAPRTVLVTRLEAELALAEQRIDDAWQLVAAALAGGVGSGAAPYERWPLLATAARVHGCRGRPATGPGPETPELAGLREAGSELPADTPLYRAYAAQVAAELADPVAAGWDQVVAAWDRLGRPYPTAYAQLRAAEARLRAGELEPARALLRTAQAHARDLGAGPLLDDIRALARGARIWLDGDPSTPTAAADGADRLGLTERETEVLRLVALGRSNREIGQALFISPKTVSVHVSNLLGKLGVGSRGQAAAVAHRLRLFGDQPGA